MRGTPDSGESGTMFFQILEFLRAQGSSRSQVLCQRGVSKALRESFEEAPRRSRGGPERFSSPRSPLRPVVGLGLGVSGFFGVLGVFGVFGFFGVCVGIRLEGLKRLAFQYGLPRGATRTLEGLMDPFTLIGTLS